MFLRTVVVLVSISLSTLGVVSAQNGNAKPWTPGYPENPGQGGKPAPYPYPDPSPSWKPSPPSTWKPPVPESTPTHEPTKPTGWIPSGTVSVPIPWQSSVPPSTVKAPTYGSPQPKPTTAWGEPSPSVSVPPKTKPTSAPPNNAGASVEPERYSRPFSTCYFGKNWYYYHRGFKSGKEFVKILLEGYEDCAESGRTIHILQQSAPYYPSASQSSSPSFYCRNLGYYKGFERAVDKFEKKCTLQCKDDGQVIGNQAGMLLCNLPSVRRFSIGLCSRSFKAGCSLEFDKVVREHCPNELNGSRYHQIKSTVCVF